MVVLWASLHRSSAIARQPRLDVPGIAQHMIQRGNDRKACFFRHSDYFRQHALGPDTLRASIEAQLGRRAGPAKIGRPRKNRETSRTALGPQFTLQNLTAWLRLTTCRKCIK